MALKLIKLTIPMEIKADPNDSDDMKERIYETLQVLMESDELSWNLDEEQEDAELED
jgi:hypothetical protein